MSDDLENFKHHLNLTQTSGGSHEATFGLLKDLAKENEEILNWVCEQFRVSDDKNLKSDLARIAVVAGGKRGEFEQYLREHDQWEDSDFEDL